MSMQLSDEQLKALGMTDMAEVQRAQFLQKIGKIVFDKTMAELIRSLNEEQLHALNYAIDSLGSFDAVVAYLYQTYPTFSKLMLNSERAFADEFISEFKKGN